jgi:hypothetical protein
MPQGVCSQPRGSVPTRSGTSHLDSSMLSSVARSSNSGPGQPAQGACSATASDLITLLDADAVDLRDVGDAIRLHPELESLVLKLCAFPALSPGVPVSRVEEAAIVLGKDRLRIVVRAWSANQWMGDRSREPGPEIPEVSQRGPEGSPALTGSAEGRHAAFLSTEFPAEILDLANFFHWTRRDAVSFVNSAGDDFSHRLDLELRKTAHLANLLVRDLLPVVSLVNPVDLSPEQEAILQEILRVRS